MYMSLLHTPKISSDRNTLLVKRANIMSGSRWSNFRTQWPRMWK